MTHEPIKHCRACGETGLKSVLDLGIQAMTGIFPANDEEAAEIERGPLAVVQCLAPECGLVQLADNYSLGEMYGDSYGYRSGLNGGMVKHLAGIVEYAAREVNLAPGDTVVDIGSNDGTLLGFYSDTLRRIGFDPTIKKFGKFYKHGIEKVPGFFGMADGTAPVRFLPDHSAKVITSIACFYDLPAPQQFVDDVASALAFDGVWIFEQSYLISMMRANAFDTVCHEHLEYYHVLPIRRMLNRAGLIISDLVLTETNGGSIRITARHGRLEDECPAVTAFLAAERGYLSDSTWFEFRARVYDAIYQVKRYLLDCKARGELVLGLGASTKGNVLLQAAGITPDLLPAIAEVNEDKFGRYTPGTGIPIISEADARALNPDRYLVLPWHFKKGFMKRMGVNRPDLVFPLPTLEVL